MAKPLTVQQIAQQRLARPVAQPSDHDGFTEDELTALHGTSAVGLPEEAGLPGDAPPSLPWWRYGADVDKRLRQAGNVAKGLGGMAWDAGKQAVTHPLDALQDASQGLEEAMPQSLSGGEDGDGLDANTMPYATLQLLLGKGPLPVVAQPLEGAAVGMGRRMASSAPVARGQAAAGSAVRRGVAWADSQIPDLNAAPRPDPFSAAGGSEAREMAARMNAGPKAALGLAAALEATRQLGDWQQESNPQAQARASAPQASNKPGVR